MMEPPSSTRATTSHGVFGNGEVGIVGSVLGMIFLQAESGEIVWQGHHLHLKIGRAVGLTNSAFS
jgi:hypothetical protein